MTPPPTVLHWPGGGSWGPSQLSSLVGWWDARDSSTIFDATSGGNTPSDNGKVARWEDKSGSGAHVTQSTSTKQPTYQLGDLNSFDGISFGTNSLDALTSSVDLGTDEVTVACVTDQTGGDASSGGNVRIIDKRGTGLAGSTLGWHVKPLVSGDAFILDQGNGNYIISGVATALSGTYILLATSDANASIRINGQDNYSANGSGGTFPTTVNNPNVDLTFGANANGQSTQGMTGGLLGEVVICDATLSTNDRNKLEGYLAHKWGLTANLPSSHPYKSSAP